MKSHFGCYFQDENTQESVAEQSNDKEKQMLSLEHTGIIFLFVVYGKVFYLNFCIVKCKFLKMEVLI